MAGLAAFFTQETKVGSMIELGELMRLGVARRTVPIDHQSGARFLINTMAFRATIGLGQRIKL